MPWLVVLPAACKKPTNKSGSCSLMVTLYAAIYHVYVFCWFLILCITYCFGVAIDVSTFAVVIYCCCCCNLLVNLVEFMISCGCISFCYCTFYIFFYFQVLSLCVWVCMCISFCRWYKEINPVCVVLCCLIVFMHITDCMSMVWCMWLVYIPCIKRF